LISKTKTNLKQQMPRQLVTTTPSPILANDSAYEKLFAFHNSSQLRPSTCDILQMLDKAQVEYDQHKADTFLAQAPVSPKPILGNKKNVKNTHISCRFAI